MQEPQRKGLKDLFKKIVKSASETEKTFHGNLGRNALDAADKAGSKLPKALSPEEYSQADMDAAINIWKNQGMGKIGNQPTGKPYSMGGDMGKYEFFSQFNDKKKPKGNYPNKPSEQRDLIRKQGISGFPDFDKADSFNGVLRREPPSKGEIAAGRAITTGAALGTGAAKAHSYWTDKKNEKK